MNKRNLFNLVLVPVLLAGIVMAGFYWSEARKEVVFLCGNFLKGVSRDSVTRQLDTGNFLRYRVEAGTTGSRIVVDSKINFGIYTCIVDFDADGSVLRAASK